MAETGSFFTGEQRAEIECIIKRELMDLLGSMPGEQAGDFEGWIAHHMDRLDRDVRMMLSARRPSASPVAADARDLRRMIRGIVGGALERIARQAQERGDALLAVSIRQEVVNWQRETACELQDNGRR